MAVYCLLCEKELVGTDLQRHETHNEILSNDGMVENYCLCKDCIDTADQAQFDSLCDEGIRRGGKREGAGRKPMKPGLKKRTKSFTLSPETAQALKDLQGFLGLPSQSAVVEFLALRGLRVVKEKQLDLF